MRQKTKITIVALVVMLFMALAVTVVSFSFADENDTASSDTVTTAVATTATNIDYIIKNSNDETLTDSNRKYRIVEIGSGTKSTLGDYVSNLGFENYVIEGNKSTDLAQVFASGNVQYNYFNAKDLTSTSSTTGMVDDDGNAMTDFAVISQADMIYVSNGSAPGYATGNDISEDLYSLIQPMAVGSYIPIIVDSPSKSGSNTAGVTVTVQKTLGNVVGDSFAGDGYYYYAFKYTDGVTPDVFYDTSITNTQSDYLTINARTQAQKGVYSTVKLNDSVASMGKMLIVSQNGGALSKSDSTASTLLSGITKAEGLVYAQTEEGAEEQAVEGDVYDITASKLYTDGYHSRYAAYNPKYIKIDDISVSELENIANLDDYDMVFFEADVKTVNISDNVASMLTGAMYGGIHIVYNANASDPSPKSGSSSSTEASGTNYEKFYNMVSTNGVAAYQNIMITDKTKIDAITGSSSSAAAKTIADLINASSYRGIGGPKSTSSNFSVLEIQPCYPIDETIAAANLAANKEGYYNDPDGVINGMTKEEIEGSGLEEGTYEYYAWELSKAKIADALDINVNNITLTQMSTEELESSKAEILGSYDLVYIGGNKSALKDLDSYYGLIKTASKNNHGNLTGSTVDDVTKLPIYTMYSHNGDFVSYDLAMQKSASFTEGVGDKLVGAEINGTYISNAFTQLNGNDLTSDNLTSLEAYVKAGMPIIFSSEVTNAYKFIADAGDTDTRYLQNSIDPDSNMCQLLNYCNSLYSYDGSTGSANNILWGFEGSNEDKTEIVDSDNGRLSLYSNTVRVYDDELRSQLSGIYTKANKRPKLVLTSTPAIYSMYDSSTILKSSTLEFVLDNSAIGTTNYTLNLYIDDSGNSLFEDGEKITSPTISVNSETGATKISTALADDFFGPVYWKLELVDNSIASKPTISSTGLSYVRPATATKQDVALLQILPGSRKLCGLGTGEGGDSGGANGLYFCTKCQQAYKNMYYNPVSSTGYGAVDYYYGSNHFSDNNVNTDGTSAKGGSILMGLHEHTFGIVAYDSELYMGTTKGADDWTHNLADDLSDFYNFSAEIMYVDDFEAYSREIEAAYADCTTDEEKEERAEQFNNLYLETKAAYDAKELEVEEAEANLNELLEYMRDNLDQGTKGWNTSLSDADKVDGINSIIQNKSYSELYAMTSNFTNVDLSTYQGNYPEANDAGGTYKSFNTLYQEWVKVHDEALLLKGGYFVNNYTYKYFSTMTEFSSVYQADKAKYDACNKTYTDAGVSDSMRIMGYQDYQKFANGDNWLKQCYTTVCVGPSEQFAGDDIDDDAALKALSDFLDNDGQLIMFHDTLSPYTDKGAVKLTALLREKAGANKNHAQVDSTKYTDVSWDAEENTLVMPWEMYLSMSVDGKSSGNWYWQNSNNTLPNEVEVNLTVNSGNCSTSEVSRSSESYAAQTKAGITTFKLNVKDSSGNPVSGKQVTITVNNKGISVSNTTDSNGYVEIKIPSYTTKTVTKTVSASDIKYTPYTTTNTTKWPTSVYFMTNLSYKSDDTKYASWMSDMKSIMKSGTEWIQYSMTYSYIAPSFTDSLIAATGGGNTSDNSDMYKYAEIAWAKAAEWNTSAASKQSEGRYATDRATKNNDAIVTMFPYQLADQIYIGGTHPQAYSIDVDYDNLTVLYSLSAGTTTHERTSIFAADPGDGVDNYFMYACDNIYYCGAGHGKITGMTKDNQNERYLYMNIICNSVRKSAFAPSIDVYDADSTEDNLKNNIVKADGAGAYEYEIDEDTVYPEFSFKVGVDDDTTLSKVEIYYDLDYVDKTVDATDASGNKVLNSDGSVKQVVQTKTDGFTEGTDVLIASWGAAGNKNKTFTADTLGYILKGDTDNLETYLDGTDVTTYLKLKDDYFAAYGGKYTYIVIKVTDSSGQVRYQRIKVTYKDKLFNLT